MYTEKRKADRLAMAAELETLIVASGAQYEREDNCSYYPQAIRLHITANKGLQLTVDLDGKSCQPDVHVLSWHGLRGDDKLNSHTFGSVNTFHWGKATDVAYGFDALCSTLEDRLAKVQSSAAFQ